MMLDCSLYPVHRDLNTQSIVYDIKSPQQSKVKVKKKRNKIIVMNTKVILNVSMQMLKTEFPNLKIMNLGKTHL